MADPILVGATSRYLAKFDDGTSLEMTLTAQTSNDASIRFVVSGQKDGAQALISVLREVLTDMGHRKGCTVEELHHDD